MIAIGSEQHRYLQLAQRWIVQYNFYINDRRWGSMFVRMCPYLPFSARVCLNQHYWLANRMREEASGSIVKKGEMVAMVTATGGNTFFGRTAKLVQSAGAQSHFQRAVMRIGDFLIITAVGLAASRAGAGLTPRRPAASSRICPDPTGRIRACCHAGCALG
jgi:hypothetical protein